MAIVLNEMVRNPTAIQKAGVPLSTKADLATGAFDLASKSIGQQVDATNVQLSPFGQIKSSFVEVQSAGKTLTTPAKTSTVEDATKAVQSFADAYNNATKVVNTVIQSGGNSTNVLAGNGYANLASASLKKIVTNGNTMVDLRNIGVSLNQDGTVSVDAEALQNAVQANSNSAQNTLFRVGAQAGQVSQQILDGAGNTGGAANTFSIRGRNSGTGAAGSQNSTADSPNAVQQQTASAVNSAAKGIAAYVQMLYF